MLKNFRRFIRKTQIRQKQDLSYLFERIDLEASLADRIDWIASLVEWIRSPSKEGGKSPSVRLRFILKLFDRQPEWKKNSALLIRSVLGEVRQVRLYSDVGLPSAPTFTSEFWRRARHILVPGYEDPESAEGAQAHIFYDEDDGTLIESITEDVWQDVLNWLRTDLAPGAQLLPDWREQMLDAARILAAQSLAIAWRSDIELRSPEFDLRHHPIARLQSRLNLLRETAAERRLTIEDLKPLHEMIPESRRFIQAVRSHLEQFGVSVDLVYQLDRMRNHLFRINRMLGMLEADVAGENLAVPAREIWVELLEGSERDGDFSEIFRKHLALLSRKIVERTGHSGEHYITQTPREYRHMLIMAGGGGFITAFTAFFKYLPVTGNWPIFLEFAYQAANYSLSFLLMHILGFKLATKQPSMTAAALAGKLKENPKKEDDEAFVDEIARISRSQCAAVIGNIALVIPVAWGINWAYEQTVGHSFLKVEASHHLLESIHPIYSGTILFASITGLLLWLSSMTAGWVENASVYARLPDVLRTHPLMRAIFGEKRSARIAETYLENVSGVVGSIALGIFLAATPSIGRFFGVPLLAHHVTLSSGAATYSVMSLGWDQLPWTTYVATAIGILMIATLNFGVSFVLALFVAVRARDLHGKRMWQIFGQAGRRLVRRPRAFFIPPRQVKPASIASP